MVVQVPLLALVEVVVSVAFLVVKLGFQMNFIKGTMVCAALLYLL